MASIRTRDDKYDVQWTDLATRKRRTRTFTSKSAAERFAGDRDGERDQVRNGLATARQVSERRYVVSVDELCERFTEHASQYYRKNGKPTSTLHNFEDAMAPLRRLYGATPAVDFGPRDLKAVREAMVEAGWSRGTVNAQVGRVRAVFRWGVEQEYVPPPVLEGLRAVGPLKRGRSEARETEPVRPVPPAYVRAIRRYVSRQVRAMVQLQRLTGMRPSEVTAMRACDLETGGKVWVYRPASHKTEHHGHERAVYLGPRAQAVVRLFLRTALEAYLFSPAEAASERPAPKGSRRREGQQETPRRTERRVGDRYTTESYRRAIARACERAKVPSWGPNRLRHNAATRLRREFGIDVAQTILGHRLGSSVTEVYAEANVRKAREVIAKVG